MWDSIVSAAARCVAVLASPTMRASKTVLAFVLPMAVLVVFGMAESDNRDGLFAGLMAIGAFLLLFAVIFDVMD